MLPITYEVCECVLFICLSLQRLPNCGLKFLAKEVAGLSRININKVKRCRSSSQIFSHCLGTSPRLPKISQYSTMVPTLAQIWDEFGIFWYTESLMPFANCTVCCL